MGFIEIGFAPTNKEVRNEALLCQEKRYPSRFGFLREINGLRPKYLTGLLGISGGGKSELLKAIMADSAKVGPILSWLSEEPKNAYHPGVIAAATVNQGTELGNIRYTEELSQKAKFLKIQRPEEVKKIVLDAIIESGAKAFFIDNLTTSSLYAERTPSFQQGVISSLNEIASELEIPVLYALHTSAGVDINFKGIIEGENVRGSKQSYMQASYFFVMQTIAVGKFLYTFVKIRKHRNQAPEEKLFRLNFQNGVYISDVAISFSDFKQIFKTRNTL